MVGSFLTPKPFPARHYDIMFTIVCCFSDKIFPSYYDWLWHLNNGAPVLDEHLWYLFSQLCIEPVGRNSQQKTIRLLLEKMRCYSDFLPGFGFRPLLFIAWPYHRYQLKPLIVNWDLKLTLSTRPDCLLTNNMPEIEYLWLFGGLRGWRRRCKRLHRLALTIIGCDCLLCPDNCIFSRWVWQIALDVRQF